MYILSASKITLYSQAIVFGRQTLGDVLYSIYTSTILYKFQTNLKKISMEENFDVFIPTLLEEISVDCAHRKIKGTPSCCTALILQLLFEKYALYNDSFYYLYDSVTMP